MAQDSSAIFSNANDYEAYIGRWSRIAALQFIDWLHIPTGGIWLDVGAGTGVLTEVIVQRVSPARVVAVDLSEDYLAFARKRIDDARVEFRMGDAADLAYESATFDAAVAGLVLNFVPAPQQAVQAMAGAVRPGGTVAAYVWDYLGHMEMVRHFWDAAAKVDPAATESAQLYAICNPDRLRSLFQAAALDPVEVIAIDFPTHFKDFDDFWLPFLGAQGSVSKYLRGLSDDRRDALRDQLRRQLPIQDDGQIPLVARAWAVKGKRQTN